MWSFRMWCEVSPMWAEALAWGHSPKITQLLSGKVLAIFIPFIAPKFLVTSFCLLSEAPDL